MDLRDSEEHLNLAQRVARIGSVEHYLDTGVTKWSDQVYRLLGLDPAVTPADYATFRSMAHPDDVARLDAGFEASRQGIDVPPIEFRIIRPDGEVRTLQRTTELLRDAAGKPFKWISILSDITERRRTEQQLVQAQKMEAVGTLTGGLAHDFNNLLGIIIGNLDMLRDLIKNDDMDELARNALEAALRGSDLTRRLLAFARRQPLRPERVDVNALVGGVIRLLSRTLGGHI
jgi:PAS domain S-box-containing protein